MMSDEMEDHGKKLSFCENSRNKRFFSSIGFVLALICAALEVAFGSYAPVDVCVSASRSLLPTQRRSGFFFPIRSFIEESVAEQFDSRTVVPGTETMTPDGRPR